MRDLFVLKYLEECSRICEFPSSSHNLASLGTEKFHNTTRPKFELTQSATDNSTTELMCFLAVQTCTDCGKQEISEKMCPSTARCPQASRHPLPERVLRITCADCEIYGERETGRSSSRSSSRAPAVIASGSKAQPSRSAMQPKADSQARPSTIRAGSERCADNLANGLELVKISSSSSFRSSHESQRGGSSGSSGETQRGGPSGSIRETQRGGPSGSSREVQRVNSSRQTQRGGSSSSSREVQQGGSSHESHHSSFGSSYRSSHSSEVVDRGSSSTSITRTTTTTTVSRGAQPTRTMAINQCPSLDGHRGGNMKLVPLSDVLRSCRIDMRAVLVKCEDANGRKWTSLNLDILPPALADRLKRTTIYQTGDGVFVDQYA